jgi:hypothetical protein
MISVHSSPDRSRVFRISISLLPTVYFTSKEPNSQGDSTMSEQEVCRRDITQTLEQALNFFHKGPTTQSPTPYLTVGEAIELVVMLGGLLTRNPYTPVEVHSQLIHSCFVDRTFQLVVGYVTLPLIFSTETVAGYSLQQTFVDLRIAALQVLNRITMESSTEPNLSATCVRAFEDSRVFHGLIAHLSSPATFETLRVACVESIFIYLLRVPGSKPTFISTHLHQSIVSCLVLEPAAIVQNYLAAVLRELANNHAHEIADANTLNACTKLIATNDSPDVRALCLETLQQCLRANTRVGGYLTQPEEILTVVKERLEKDPAAAVVEVAAKFLEDLFHASFATATPATFEVATGLHLYRSLIFSLKHPPGPASAAARCLRFFVQYAPSHLQVGYHIVTEFQSLSALLKATMDLGQTMKSTNGMPHGQFGSGTGEDAGSLAMGRQTLMVELALGISLLLAQSPVNRQQLFRELHGFPLWSSALREALVTFLNSAALEYFGGIDIVDVTGVHINEVHKVEWGDGMKPKKSSIRQIFTSQEQRVRDQRIDRPTAVPQLPEHEQRRHMKLTFVILNYAVHLTLAPEEAAAAPPGHGDPHLAAAGPATPLRTAGGYGTESPVAGRPSAPLHQQPQSPGAGAPGTPSHRRAASAGSRRAPMFPNPHSPSAQQTLDFSRVRTQKEIQEAAIAYDKFDSCFKFVSEYAQWYAKKVKSDAVYEPTPDGFVVRRDKLQNPWGPIVKKQRLRSWVVSDMKEGDLFYFAIPFDDLKLFALDTVIERAKRHLATLKKNFITTPQVAKGRRWFLHDMMENVIPKAIELLSTLRGFVERHGGENVRFPLFLFREKEMHLGERAVHPANLTQVVEQVKFYFSQSPGEILGVDPEYVAKVEERIQELASQRYMGQPIGDGLPEDEDDGYPGHGGLSSDSDGE